MKCADKKEWTKHEIEKKETKEKKGYKHEYHDRVELAKERLKCINYYIADYQDIIDDYNKEHNKI